MKVIVMGLGAVGSAAAWRLAAAGHEVLGFDSFDPPHSHGSTHAESRLTRETAWEGAEYVPLVKRANQLWRELAAEVRESFFIRNGGLFIAPADAHVITGSRRSADLAGLPYEMLRAEEMRRRWPHLDVEDRMVGFLDPSAGVLFPEPIVRAEQAVARSLGAQLRMQEAIRAWRAVGDGVEVETARGRYAADRLIICTGAWMYEVLVPLGVDLKVERTSLHWFQAATGGPLMDPRHAPVHVISDDGHHATVVFPTLNGLVKVAGHGSGEYTTPEHLDRAISDRDRAPAVAVAHKYFPRHLGEWVKGAVCMYTVAPHGQFILDHHPEHRQVVLGSPCSGFGFKFSAATGEALAALATGARPPVPVDAWPLANAKLPVPADPSG